MESSSVSEQWVAIMFKESGNVEPIALVSSFNSFWSGDAIWWHRSGLTLVQVMVCYMVVPSHYLNQCSLIIKAFNSIRLKCFTKSAQDICKVSLEITLWSLLRHLPEPTNDFIPGSEMRVCTEWQELIQELNLDQPFMTICKYGSHSTN